MTKILDNRGFFLVLALLLISADTAILLDILFIRQIGGFLFLTILPGLLILQILKLNKIGYTEKFVLSVGLSVSFLMLFGLLLNNLSLVSGYKTPLATIPLLISFNIVFVVFAIVGQMINKTQTFSFPNLNLSASEKAFLIVPIFFPSVSIFGMHVMNTTDNNIILMFLLFLIPIYVVFVCFLNYKFPTRLYPVVIFLISIALLLLMALRSDHIIGSDTHREYYFFLTTLDNLHWKILAHTTLDACLSISLLPTIYQSILNIPSEFLFKILYPLIYSVSPLAIYVSSKKYVGELYAFLASCFFMFQFNFLETTANSRTCIAVLFFALAMMVLFYDKIEPLKKRILFILFMASCMVSHYTTTYIFFFIIFGAFIGIEILSKKYTGKKAISLTIVILFFGLVFFWYSQVTAAPFNAGVGFIENTLTNLNRFFIEESRQTDVQAMFGHDILQKGIPHKMEFVFTWLTFVLIGIGVITLLRKYKEMSFSELSFKKPDFLKEKFEVTYFVIVLVCAGLLVVMVTLPFISIGYDLYRLYAMGITILSVFFVIGGIILSKNLSFIKKDLPKRQKQGRKSVMCVEKENISQQALGKFDQNISQVRACLIILLILIPYFLCVNGVIYNIFSDNRAIILSSSEGASYVMNYVHDQDSYGAKWLSGYGESDFRLYTDHRGADIVISQGKRNPYSIRAYSLFTNKELTSGYTFLRYTNSVQGKLISYTYIYDVAEISNTLYRLNKIYDNDAWIYKND